MVACLIGAHAMEFSTVSRLTSLSMRLAGTAGFEPALNTALETAVLPLNYVPKMAERKGYRVKKNRPSGVPEGGSAVFA